MPLLSLLNLRFAMANYPFMLTTKVGSMVSFWHAANDIIIMFINAARDDIQPG